jgi:hypothetical protein
MPMIASLRPKAGSRDAPETAKPIQPALPSYSMDIKKASISYGSSNGDGVWRGYIWREIIQKIHFNQDIKNPPLSIHRHLAATSISILLAATSISCRH